jgi:predicted dehydrogenase
MLRCGLLGTGDAGRHHIRALAAMPEVAWTAVGARDISKLAAQRAALGVPETTRLMSTDELLAGGSCDAVIVATPDGLHHEHVSRALAAGMHVLVEKPLALEVEHARALVDAAHAAGRVLQVGYHLRHHAGHELVRARLAELVGTVRAVHIGWAWPDPAADGWRAHGQGARWWALAALGTHAIDLALWLVDAEVTGTASLVEPPHGPGSERGRIDHAAEVSLRFATGALAHVSVAITHRAQPVISIAGDRGEIQARDTLGARGAGAIVCRAAGATETLSFAAEDPYLRQLRAFAARCTAGPLVDPHAITNVELLHRITSP